MKTATLILAAGKGTRMKSDLAKVLHPISQRPMIHYVIDQAKNIDSDPVVLIIGHQREKVMQETHDRDVKYAIQDQQLGTGHAVLQAKDSLENFKGSVLILSGDVPLLTSKTLDMFINSHQNSNAKASLLSAKLDDPTGYGRVVRHPDGSLDRIVEHKDADETTLKIDEINTGIYIFDSEDLFRLLQEVKNDNVQGEYYLPDVIPMLISEGHSVNVTTTDDFDETRGINTIEQLKQAETILLNRHG